MPGPGGGLGRPKGKRLERTAKPVGLRVNRRIRVPQVRVIGAEGEQLGVMTTHEALGMAKDIGLDLVEVSPLAKPPVCKLMDHGKFKYDQKRKASQARKNQQQISLKEIKLRPKTDEHDFAVKMNHLKRFLTEGNKTKVTVVLRGREIVHKDIAANLLMRVRDEVAQMTTVVETTPHLEGRQFFMILAPGKTSAKKKEKSVQENNQTSPVRQAPVHAEEEDKA